MTTTASEEVLSVEALPPTQDARVPDIRYAIGSCTYGSVLVAESALGICAIALGDDATTVKRELADRHPGAVRVGDADFAARVADVIAFIEARAADGPRSLALPLDMRGSAFQRRVWRALQDIPVGSTMTYAAVARHIGAPTAVRAVAHACATNVLAVVIPCHRVVRSDGGLAGYRWGVERKRALLAQEQGATDLFASAGAAGGAGG